MSSATVQREVCLFLAITYCLAIAIVLILPDTSDAAPLLTIFAPLIATVIVIAVAVPAGQRRAAWAGLSLQRLGWQEWPAAVAIPAGIAIVSYAVAFGLGVVQFSSEGLTVSVLEDFLVTLALFTVVILGEEIGWRGFLLPRLAAVMRFDRAALATGAAHAVFHLPLYLLGSTYNAAGSRWIVVPVSLVSITFGGVIYAWLRQSSASVWPVALAHNSFNTIFDTIAGLAVVSSPAALAYVAGETGVVTMALTIVTALLVIRRSQLFRQDAFSLRTAAPTT